MNKVKALNFFFFLFISFFLVDVANANSKNSFYLQVNKSNNMKVAIKWYEGGTLHKSNGLEWQNADGSNRLATAADFVIVILGDKAVPKNRDFDTYLLPKAFGLKKCLDEATNYKAVNIDEREKFKNMLKGMKVSGTAVICAVLMGWELKK